MKKVSTARTGKIEKVAGQKLTVGLDLRDRSSWYCVLNEAGEVLLEQKLAATPKAMQDFGTSVALGAVHAKRVQVPSISESRKAGLLNRPRMQVKQRSGCGSAFVPLTDVSSPRNWSDR